MKKVLGLLLLSSSLFSMQLAHKLQTPGNRFKSALVKAHKLKAMQIVAANTINTQKIHIDASSIHVPHNLTDVKLYHSKKGFVVLHDNKKHVIEKCFMDQNARSIKQEQLKSFLKTGYFALNQTNDGTFTLKAQHRLTGGGPMFGAFMYWVTKSLCYGTAAAAVGGTIVATGGAAAGALGASGTTAAVTGAVAAKTTATVVAAKATGAIVATAATSTVGTAIATTAGTVVAGTATATAVASGTGGVALVIGAASTVTGATVAGVAVGEAAAMTTAVGMTVAASSGTAATVGTGAAIVMGIESLSVAVGTFFGMLPTP